MADRMFEGSFSNKALSDLEWGHLREHLAARCVTEQGAALARSWRVEVSPQTAADLSAEIQELRALADDGKALVVEADLDLEGPLAVVAKEGVLDSEGLRKVASVLAFGSRLRRKSAQMADRAPRLARRLSALRPLTDIWGPIADSFGPDGTLRDEAGSELGSLRARARAIRERIIDRLKEIMERPDMVKVLQDKYYTLREERYVLPVKVEMQHLFRGIVHGRSQTGLTLFVEPAEITEQGNKLKMALADVELEEMRVFAELSGLVREELPAIRANLDILARLDALAAASLLAQDMDGRPVSLTEDEGLELLEARHPLMVLAGDEVVPNTFVLPKGGGLVITGPNAGGKTVALKTMGLVVLMARSGLHVPCREGSRVPLYDSVLTTMGDDQDLSAGLSTFTAHMKTIDGILRSAGADSLVLLDEVAVGTEPTQGAALAQAILEALAELGCSVVVTTHYTSLKALAATDQRFRNAAMGYLPADNRPTYRIEMDAMGRSSALETARSIGLPESVLERASELLGGQQLKLDGLLAEVEQRRAELADKAARLEEELARAIRERDKAAQIRRRLSQELDLLRRKAHDEAVAELTSLRADLERLRKQLRKQDAPSEQIIQEMERRAGDKADKLRALAPPPADMRGRKPGPGEVQKGTVVVVVPMRAKGEVVSLDGRGKAKVSVGGVQVTARIADLLLPEKEGRDRRRESGERAARTSPLQKSAAPQADASDADFLVRAEAEEVDLRGLRVDEALDRMDALLDRCLRDGQRAVLVIHGHGTGALKRALRDFLRSHKLVQSMRPGRRGEGGDGVTLVFLRA